MIVRIGTTRLAAIVAACFILPGLWRVVQFWHPRSVSLQPDVLIIWWWTLCGYAGISFLISALLLVLPFARRFDPMDVAISLFHLFVMWTFFAAMFITADRLAMPELEAVGLGGLHLWLLVMALLSAAFFLLSLFAGEAKFIKRGPQDIRPK
jgi:hypothetical protein